MAAPDAGHHRTIGVHPPRRGDRAHHYQPELDLTTGNGVGMHDEFAVLDGSPELGFELEPLGCAPDAACCQLDGGGAGAGDPAGGIEGERVALAPVAGDQPPVMVRRVGTQLCAPGVEHVGRRRQVGGPAPGAATARWTTRPSDTASIWVPRLKTALRSSLRDRSWPTAALISAAARAAGAGSRRSMATIAPSARSRSSASPLRTITTEKAWAALPAKARTTNMAGWAGGPPVVACSTATDATVPATATETINRFRTRGCRAAERAWPGRPWSSRR